MGKKRELNALDLFAGAGGMSEGFEQAGFNVVAAVEYDQQISETYKHNHPNTVMVVRDIKEIESREIKRLFEKQKKQCDVIFGGPPCQGFSMAGYRIRNSHSFLDDERNYLFKEYIRFVKALLPKVFVIENVPGILNYGNGAVKDEIYRTFEEMGYTLDSKVLCAADYGVPQIRHRAIIIGNRVGIDSLKLFPKAGFSEENYTTVYDAISDLPVLNSGEGTDDIDYSNKALTEYQKLLRGNVKRLYNHVSSSHSPQTIEILKMIQPGQTMKDLPEQYHTKSVHSGAYGRMEYDKPAYTITTRLNTPSVGRITHPNQDRTITPREAARIQSFPDRYRFLGDITSVGMQIGNAVPPMLARAIASQIKKFLQ